MLLILGAVLSVLAGISHPGVPGRWLTLTIIVCNDDWASKGSNLAECVAAGFDLLFIQEGKGERYRELKDPETGDRYLPYTHYGVHQDTRSPARAGSVVVWLHTAFTRTGAGFTFGVKAPGILTRWIAWCRGHLGPIRAWVASAHWPPVRVSRWQPLYSAALWARVRLAIAARRFILIGTDSNQHGGPHTLPASLTFTTAVPGSIDGLIHSRRHHGRHVQVISAVELPKGTSDHHPQRFVIRVPI